MSKTKLLVLAAMLLIVASAKSKDKDTDFETGSSYNKVDDSTTVHARFWLHTSDVQDSLDLSYTFPGKKQTSYVSPKWMLSLYHKNNPRTDPVVVKLLLNDTGLARALELKFVKHDNQSGGDFFEAELTDELETSLLSARMLEVFPPEGETAGTCKISGDQVNKLKTFLKNSAAMKLKR